VCFAGPCFAIEHEAVCRLPAKVFGILFGDLMRFARKLRIEILKGHSCQESAHQAGTSKICFDGHLFGAFFFSPFSFLGDNRAARIAMILLSPAEKRDKFRRGLVSASLAGSWRRSWLVFFFFYCVFDFFHVYALVIK